MATIRDLERRNADLERRVPHGPGVSTAFGGEVRPVQVGFPAVISAAWDATVGYTCQQRLVDPASAAVVTDSLPRTVNYVFTVDNDTSLPVGTVGWLEPDPSAGGWVLTPGRRSAGGFFARLTSSSSGRWKWVALTLDGTPAPADDGAESATYSAVPHSPFGAATPAPVAGDRVWMWPSEQAGYYEFVALETFRASGSGSSRGLVPDPGSKAGTTRYLREDATWATAVVADGDYGDITVSSSGTVWNIDANAVGDAEIRQSAGLSVIGRGANSTGNVADITAGSDYYCLRRDGTSIGFGVLSIQGGGTGKATQTAGFDALAPTTKAGDISVHDGTNNVRLAVGTDGYVLTANSKTAEGVSWAAASGSGYATVQEEGSSLTARTTLNFVGSGITAADDSKNSRTNVTLGTNLNALDGVTSAADKVPYFTGSGTAGTTDFPSFGRTLVGSASASAALTNLGISGLTWTKVTKTYTDFSDAGMSKEISVYTLPAKGCIHAVIIKHTVKFEGGGIGSYTVSVGTTAGYTRYANAQTVSGDPADTLFTANGGTVSGNNPQPEDFGASTTIYAQAVANAALSDATAGSVDIYFLTSTLP